MADEAGQRRREPGLPGRWREDDTPLVPVRVDGKTVRGARNAVGSQVHLLAALVGVQGVVAAQTEVGAKTNEIPMIIPLLDGLDLDQAVVTADALHCQRATAEYLHRRGADFILPAKDNQPGLFDALDALPWRDVPVGGPTGREPGRGGPGADRGTAHEAGRGPVTGAPGARTSRACQSRYVETATQILHRLTSL